MTDYSELDRLIVEALAAGRSPYVGPTWREAHRIGPRDVFDLIIRRIDALHAAGKIEHQEASPSTGRARWVAAEGADA